MRRLPAPESQHETLGCRESKGKRLLGHLWFRCIGVIAILLGLGCGNDPVQPSSANANDAILNETVFGTEEQWSAIFDLGVDSGDNVYFGGERDNARRLGLIE